MVSQDPTDFGEGDGRMSRSLALVAWLGTPTGRRVWIALMVAFTVLAILGAIAGSGEEMAPA
jgi:hypothetical protein